MDGQTDTGRRRTPRRLAWVILGILVATVGVMVVVGLSGDDGASEADSVSASRFATSSTTTTALTTSTTAAKIVWQYPHTTSYEIATPDGYTGRVLFERGVLLRASAVASSIPNVCPLDRAKDVVVPFRVTVTNTTRGFPTEPRAGLTLSMPRVRDWRELGLRAVVAYSSGPTCEEQPGFGNVSLSVGPASPLPPEGRVQVTGWFVVSEFYSPATPEGDRESLRHVVVFVGAAPPFKLTAATNAIRREYPLDTTAWLVPLDPVSDGGCSVRDCS